MSEKISVSNLTQGNFLSTAVITTMSDSVAPGEDFIEKFNVHGGDIDFKLEINGVEVSFSHFIKHLEEDYESNVRREAQILISEKFTTINRSLSTIENVVEQELASLEIKI